MKRLIITLFALSATQFAMSQNGEVREFTANGVKFEMVCVDGGTFQMGEPGKAEETEVGSFLIGRTEVTGDLWKAVMGKNPSSVRGRGKGMPVESVSWNDCKAFVEKLSQLTGQKFRLPIRSPPRQVQWRRWWWLALGRRLGSNRQPQGHHEQVQQCQELGRRPSQQLL